MRGERQAEIGRVPCQIGEQTLGEDCLEQGGLPRAAIPNHQDHVGIKCPQVLRHREQPFAEGLGGLCLRLSVPQVGEGLQHVHLVFFP